MLCQFDDVFVVMHHGLKFLFYSVGNLCGIPDVGFQEVSQKFAGLLSVFSSK